MNDHFLDVPEAYENDRQAGLDQQYIWVHNWEQVQTYQRRRDKYWAPPWIKLRTDLYRHGPFLDLTAETRSLLVGIWALFASTRGTLTKDTRRLSRQLHQRVTKRQLERLNDAGFIDFCSGTVREQRWNAFMNSSNLEVEKEKEVDKEPPYPPQKRGNKPSRRTTKTKSKQVCPDCEVGAGQHAIDCPRIGPPATVQVELPAHANGTFYD